MDTRFVVLLESVPFVLSSGVAHHFARVGLPLWGWPALGWSQAAAALLFLIPITMLVGRCGLLLIFAVANAIHIPAAVFSAGRLIVYAVAVVVCITNRENIYERH
jgi:hypothetical protein